MRELGTFAESIGNTVGIIVTKIGDSIGNIIDKVSDLKSAGTDATTKQIKELSKIPAEPMLAVANAINAMKEALDGFGGGTFNKIAGKLFGGGGPIDKIVELTKKVPELMQAAEAISVLGAAGSNYAMAEAELERRKKVSELKKDLAGSYMTKSGRSEDAAELAALEGQAMAMPTGGVGAAALQGQAIPMSDNIGGNLGKIEKLVQEIVTMKREAAKGGGNVLTDASQNYSDASKKTINLSGNGTQLVDTKTAQYDGSPF